MGQPGAPEETRHYWKKPGWSHHLPAPNREPMKLKPELVTRQTISTKVQSDQPLGQGGVQHPGAHTEPVLGHSN